MALALQTTETGDTMSNTASDRLYILKDAENFSSWDFFREQGLIPALENPGKHTGKILDAIRLLDNSIPHQEGQFAGYNTTQLILARKYLAERLPDAKRYDAIRAAVPRLDGRVIPSDTIEDLTYMSVDPDTAPFPETGKRGEILPYARTVTPYGTYDLLPLENSTFIYNPGVVGNVIEFDQDRFMRAAARYCRNMKPVKARQQYFSNLLEAVDLVKELERETSDPDMRSRLNGAQLELRRIGGMSSAELADLLTKENGEQDPAAIRDHRWSFFYPLDPSKPGRCSYKGIRPRKAKEPGNWSY